MKQATSHGSMPKDENLAARLYKQASDEGVPYAQYKLAQFYEEGKGRLPDDRYEARRLYRLAAYQGEKTPLWLSPITN